MDNLLLWFALLLALTILVTVGALLSLWRARARVAPPPPPVYVAEGVAPTRLSSHSETETVTGKQHLTLALKRIAYERDGSWRRITNMIGNTGDPALSLGVDELVQFRIRPRLSGNAPVMHFGHGQSMVRLTPLGTANVDGRVQGQSITFPGAWTGADLTYTVAGHRLQEDIALRAGHPRTFAFRIDEHVGFDPTMLTFGNDFRALQPVLRGPEGPALDVPLTWLVTQQGGRWVLSVTLPAGDWAGWTLDPTLSLQPDAADGMDAGIRNDASNFNIGAATYIGMGHDGARTYRGLIKFNLADLPATAVISSAVLSLWCGGDYAANARTFRVYRQKRAWVEGNKVNADDTPASGATWARYDTTNAWQTAGGFGANDCEQTDIGSRDFTAAETLEEWKDFPLTPTSKTALDLGNGWMIKPDTEISDHYSFRSSDYATAARRPKLVIVYTLPSCRRALRGVGS